MLKPTHIIKQILAFFFLVPILYFINAAEHPFAHDLHLFSIPGKSARTMLCFHGYDGNYQIAQKLKNLQCIDATLVSFNFPDHDLQKRRYDPNRATFGTIGELLPAFYVLKKCVVDGGLASIDLYGFSAGGGALINLIAILNTGDYALELERIGIGKKEKKALLGAIQKGVVILDTPLKSIEEIIDLRGTSKELEICAKNYRENHLRPIDSLRCLKGLSLDVIVHFQEIDAILFNRDDALYVERLKTANVLGTTALVVGRDGGHNVPHRSLWQFYKQKMQGAISMSYVLEKQGKRFVIGIPIKTSNENGRFQQEAPPLWERFRTERLAEKIPNRISENLFAVYTDYEGDYTEPFTYLIGCEVSSLSAVSQGMVGMEIAPSQYAIFTAKGKFPESIIYTWQTIWKADFQRSYTSDFEIYSPGFNPFNPQNNPEVSVYIAVYPN